MMATFTKTLAGRLAITLFAFANCVMFGFSIAHSDVFPIVSSAVGASAGAISVFMFLQDGKES